MSDRDLIARLAHALRVQLDGVNLYSELLAEADAHQGKPGGGAMSGDRLRSSLAEMVRIIERHGSAGIDDFDVPYVAAAMTRARALLAQPGSESMSGDRLRELCAELVEALDAELDLFETRHSDLIDRARALLAEAQPQPGEPTDPAWREFIEAVQHAQHVAVREGESPRFDLVATAFALWRSAAPEPVSVAERMPEAKHCTTNPRTGDGQWCWGWVQHDPVFYSGRWRMMPRAFLEDEARFWLPHWALPVPLPTTEQ
jgi:hypothetical protein